jgi:hypothetical protein
MNDSSGMPATFPARQIGRLSLMQEQTVATTVRANKPSQRQYEPFRRFQRSKAQYQVG